VPNVDGLRKDLIEQMRKIKASVVRFPGGCFADSYDWQDGIGPPTSARAARISGLAKLRQNRQPATATTRIRWGPTSSCIFAG
jgi:alpha-L-arabinofuranosidase